MTIIFDQLPDAFTAESFMCQSSFGKRKLTSCCGFMVFIISTASSYKKYFFSSLFGALKYELSAPFLGIFILETFGFLWL